MTAKTKNESKGRSNHKLNTSKQHAYTNSKDIKYCRIHGNKFHKKMYNFPLHDISTLSSPSHIKQVLDLTTFSVSPPSSCEQYQKKKIYQTCLLIFSKNIKIHKQNNNILRTQLKF